MSDGTKSGSSGGLSLGQFLRQEREKRGVALEQVASATKVNLRFLQLLEADQYADLPAKPFVRGFVIAYTRYIGVNSQEVLQNFHTFLDEHAQRESTGPSIDQRQFETNDAEKSRRTLWVVMAAFLVLGSIVLFVIKPRLKHRKVQHIEQLRAAHESPSPTPTQTTLVAGSPSPSPTPSKSVKPKPSPLPTPSETPAPVPSPASKSLESNRQPEATDPLNKGDTLQPDEILYKVVLKALEDTWVRYKVDGRESTTIVLRRNSILVMRATESIRFEVNEPKHLQYRSQNRGYAPLESAKPAANKGTHTSYVFGAPQAMEREDPFIDSKPLPPVPRGTGPEQSTEPSPTP